MALTHLRRERRKDGNKELAAPVPGAEQDYSYGLVIRLENNELDKLGVKQLPKAGSEVTFTARAKVIRIAQSATAANKGDRNVELQITHLDFAEGKEEKGEREPTRAAPAARTSGRGNVGQMGDSSKRANVGAMAGGDKKANVGRAGKTDGAFAE